MDDKTLLELAAKAAGMEFATAIPAPAIIARFQNGSISRVMPWNPITDDGDALRLAVKLRIQVPIIGDGMHADPHAATRRAIVCAAAALGEKT